jgi:hypothetical protein
VEKLNSIKKLKPNILAPMMPGTFAFLDANTVSIGILMMPNKIPKA